VADKSSIEWTEATWNPTTGCDRITAGCDNCYALTLAKRLKAMGNPKYQTDGDPRTSGPGFGVRPRGRARHPAALAIAARRVRQQHERPVPRARADRLHPPRVRRDGRDAAAHLPAAHQAADPAGAARRRWYGRTTSGWACRSSSSARRGASTGCVEVPAAVRFISAEPLLGPLELDLTGIHWLIAGGESGAGHRPMREPWVTSLRDQCDAAGAAFFFKQWGGRTPKAGGRLLDGRTWDAMPIRHASSTSVGV
jgi:protein gp37